MEQNLKSGTCPKCGSTEVFTTKGLGKRGERIQLVISSTKWIFLDTYVCTNCFHFEEYACDEDAKDPKKIAKITETWNKVN